MHGYKNRLMRKKLFILIMVLCTLSATTTAQTTAERYHAYIEKYAKIAQEQQREHGVPASITLAQGLLESAAGHSELATKAHNHFGIKCAGDWTGATYRYDDDTKNECFRKYRHAKESYHDHSLFLKRKRYESLFTLAVTDYKGWAHGLKRCGYATDPGYATKLINLIETYDLAKYALLDNEREEPATEVEVTEREAQKEQATSQKEQATSTKRKDKSDRQELTLAGDMGSVDLIIEHEVLRNNGKRYVIAREGDTFLSIAYEFNIYDSALRRYNDVINPRYELQPGDKVYLQKKRKRAQRKYATYRVKKNENIWQIAQDKGMRLQTIYDLNGIPEGENVTVNQKLRLR